MSRRRDRLGALLADLRYARRQMRRSPGFTLIAAFALALGIGATTAMFTLVDHVLLRPLPFPHAERLVYVAAILVPALRATRSDPVTALQAE